MESEKAKNVPQKPFLGIRAERDNKKAILLLISAAACLAAVYIARIFHLLEEPLFSRVYYGNLNGVFYSVCAAIFYAITAILVCILVKVKVGFKIFRKVDGKLGIVRRAIVYAIVLAFALGISIYLNFTLKVVYELGEKITGVQLTSNSVRYVREAAKILLAIIIIALVQEAFEIFFDSRYPIPYGGIVLFLTYGVLEFIFDYSAFSPVYLVFTLIYGIIYLLLEKRTGMTFIVSLILYVL